MNLNIATALDSQPKYRLARLPTPLHELPRLREALGGAARCPRILIKRDDLTDLALGGNKARKLEFLVGDALRKGATALVTTGAVQSNHARMTAAAARLAGLRVSLVLTADRAEPDIQGNLLLDRLMGADVHFVNGGDPVIAASQDAAEVEAVARVMEDLQTAGEQPYFVVLGGSCRIGTLGYVQFTRELLAQLDAMNCSPALLYYASGSRGTQAGLELGARLFGATYKCVGIAVSGGEGEKRVKAARIATEAAEILGSSLRLHGDDLLTDQGHYGTAYGVPTPEGVDAIRLLASTEAIFLDPVYTSKGMAGLIAHIRNGSIDPAQTVVFLHTGGLPALFAKADQVESLTGAAS